MNVVSVILTILAVVAFLVWATPHSNPAPARLHTGWFGLALLAVAWLLEATWTSAHHLHF